jgi:uncharacterized membrane protein YphA (DoxX/SURF4 family)
MKVTLEIELKRPLRWLLAAVLLWAALSKLANLQEFYADLLAYRLPLAVPLVRLAAMSLPWLELLCGLLLLVGGPGRAALAWTSALFALFVLATGQAWARGLDISCGCFHLDFLGNAKLVKLFESIPFAFFRAGLLLAGAIYLFQQQEPRRLFGAKARLSRAGDRDDITSAIYPGHGCP